MKRILTYFMFVLIGLSLENAYAGRSSFSSSRSSRTTSFSRPSTPKPSSTKPAATPTPAPSKSVTTVKETPAKTTTVTATTNRNNKSTTITKTKTVDRTKAVAPSKLSKDIRKKNAMASKKYKGPEGRKKADEDFRKEKSASYTNKFDKEPENRPDYIPASVNRGGTSYHVVYNSDPLYHGYGYWNAVNGIQTWIILDMMSDMVVTDAMLSHHGYGYYRNGAPYTPVEASKVIIYVFAGVLIIATLGGIVAVINKGV